MSRKLTIADAANALPKADSVGSIRPLRQRSKAPEGKVKMSVWIDKRPHRRLLEICIEKNTSQQQIMLQALDMWLIENGEPTIQDMTNGDTQ